LSAAEVGRTARIISNATNGVRIVRMGGISSA
jgi:hypothetical protein